MSFGRPYLGIPWNIRTKLTLFSRN